MELDPYQIYLVIEDTLHQILHCSPRTLIQHIQDLTFDLFQRTTVVKDILQVENYFRQFIHKIEEYYTRRMQKLEFFVQKAQSLQNNSKILNITLNRIKKYKVKKPWRLQDSINTKILRTQQQDDKNCNQILNRVQAYQDDQIVSGTSTPFSHYTDIPSIPDNLNDSLNQAVYFDDTLLSSSRSKTTLQTNIDLNICDFFNLYEMRQKLTKSNNLQHAQLQDLIIELDLSGIKSFRENRIEIYNENGNEKSFLELFNDSSSDISKIPDHRDSKPQIKNIITDINFGDFDDSDKQAVSNVPILNDTFEDIQIVSLQRIASSSERILIHEFIYNEMDSEIAIKEIFNYVENHKIKKSWNLKQSPMKQQISPTNQHAKRYRVKSSYDRSASYTKNLLMNKSSLNIKPMMQFNVSTDNLQPRISKKSLSSLFFHDISQASTPGKMIASTPGKIVSPQKKIFVKKLQPEQNMNHISNIYRFFKGNMQPQKKAVKRQSQVNSSKQYHSVDKSPQFVYSMLSSERKLKQRDSSVKLTKRVIQSGASQQIKSSSQRTYFD